jgi:histidinol-phosphate aminotransferase
MTILQERALLEKELQQLPVVKRIYPSDANFLLVEVTGADAIYHYLVSQKVIVRNRNSVVHNCIRITVGTAEENKMLLQALRNYGNGN